MVDNRYFCGALLAVLIALCDGVSRAEDAWEAGPATIRIPVGNYGRRSGCQNIARVPKPR